jgi:4-hydroxybenzoate polyprenyltransferase
MATDQKPLDAVRNSWVDAAPQLVQPYLRLARLDRPVGAWLLLLPCWWGLALGPLTNASEALGYAALFAVGALVMRAAGCVYNDIVDADLDAQVARTAGRPIPAGQVTKRQAWAFLVLLCAMGLTILLQFNDLSIALGVGSLALVAAYPFMKRITWWPQAWLGLTFNWGVWIGWAAVTNTIAGPVWLLYGAGIAWTLAYDTIYALQDREDDALAGIKSSARRLGAQAKPMIGLFFLGSWIFTLAALLSAGGSFALALVAIMPAIAHGAWQTASLKPDDAENCLVRFRSNRDYGLLILAALIATNLFLAHI